MTAQTELTAMQADLRGLQSADLTVAEFCRNCRTRRILLDALPEQFGLVLENLLGRLEANSLFAGESCSFS